MFEGQRRLHGDLISGPGVQVHACEIRSFWQVGVISNGHQTSAEKPYVVMEICEALLHLNGSIIRDPIMSVKYGAVASTLDFL